VVQGKARSIAEEQAATGNCRRTEDGRTHPGSLSLGWRRGVVVSSVHRVNKVNARRVRLVPSGGYTISVCNKPTRSTQPYIPAGSLNRVLASAGVRAGMSLLLGGR